MKHQSFVYTKLIDQTVLFLTIQFNISHLFAPSLDVKKFYLTLSGATFLGQSGPGSDGKEGVPRIPQSSALVDPYHQIVSCYIVGGGYYPSVIYSVIYRPSRLD